jgi:hypothetical protein
MKYAALLLIVLLETFGSLGQVSSYRSRIVEVTKGNPQCLLTFYQYKYESSFTLLEKHVLGPPTYLLWQDSPATWIQKMSYYLDSGNVVDTLFEVLRFDQPELFTYVLKKLEVIKSQELKPGLIRFETNHGDSIVKVIRKQEEVAIIECFVDGHTIKKEIRGSQLDKGLSFNDDGSIRDQRLSINYHYNTNLELYKLYILLNAAIVQFESRRTLAD